MGLHLQLMIQLTQAFCKSRGADWESMSEINNMIPNTMSVEVETQIERPASLTLVCVE
jgi:hypothetical protein